MEDKENSEFFLTIPKSNPLNKLIYTLGTGRRTEDDFIEIIFSYDINVVIDVRRSPLSSIPTFNRGYLQRLLQKEGVLYYFFGDELGGFRKGGYENYAKSDDFKNAVDRLENIVNGRKAVIICAEKLPWKCHRKWIARELFKRGWKVEHIIDKGRVWIPKQLDIQT